MANTTLQSLPSMVGLNCSVSDRCFPTWEGKADAGLAERMTQVLLGFPLCTDWPSSHGETCLVSVPQGQLKASEYLEFRDWQLAGACSTLLIFETPFQTMKWNLYVMLLGPFNRVPCAAQLYWIDKGALCSHTLSQWQRQPK